MPQLPNNGWKFREDMASKYAEGKFQMFALHANRLLTLGIENFGSVSITSDFMFQFIKPLLHKNFYKQKRYCSINIARKIRTVLVKTPDINDDFLKTFPDNSPNYRSTNITNDYDMAHKSTYTVVLEKKPTSCKFERWTLFHSWLQSFG